MWAKAFDAKPIPKQIEVAGVALLALESPAYGISACTSLSVQFWDRS